MFGLLSLVTSSFAAPGDVVDVATKAGDFKTLLAAVQAAGLAETLQGAGPYTIFAPTDAAFAALPAGTVENLLKPENKDQLVALLTYHVVPSKLMAADVKAGAVASVQGDTIDISMAEGKVKVDAANVVKADVGATNGVIHVIDAVIMPAPPAPAPVPEPEPVDPNIVNVAVANGSFGTLVAAAQAAGLAETLSGPGPFTVFAPNDAAFAKLPAGTVEDLLKPENKDKLASILKYHVVSGEVMSAAIVSGKVATVNGQDLKVKVKDGAVTINKTTKVVTADVDASNGVIHVVDTVLMPK